MSRQRPERERAIAADLAAVQTRLARQGLRRALPLLDGLRIASPCDQEWGDMLLGDDERSRHCLACRKSVYDISALTPEAAEEFLRTRVGNAPCVRIFRRADGTIVTRQDCSVGVTRARLRRGALAVAAAGATMLCAVAVSVATAPSDGRSVSSTRTKLPTNVVPPSDAPVFEGRIHATAGAPPPMHPVQRGAKKPWE